MDISGGAWSSICHLSRQENANGRRIVAEKERQLILFVSKGDDGDGATTGELESVPEGVVVMWDTVDVGYMVIGYMVKSDICSTFCWSHLLMVT